MIIGCLYLWGFVWTYDLYKEFIVRSPEKDWGS